MVELIICFVKIVINVGKMKILCRDPVHVASMKKINEELMIFDRLIHINPRHETVETKISEILRDL